MTAGNQPRPLDESLYDLEQDEYEFLSSQTGIEDPTELKQHVSTVQREIYNVRPYDCIRTFSFAKLKMCRYPTAYADLLKLGRERAGALYLDLGCCVGNDLRKAVADGFPVSQVLACDLHEFWEMGHKLFKTTPETFPVPFIQADVFDTACLAPLPLPSAPPPEPLPPLATLQTLTSLAGSLSAIHTSSFFHLFSEGQQLQLARLIAPLLRPEPGSMIFGGHVGLPRRGFHNHKNTHGIQMFCHSPESWKEMWAQVFPAGAVRVEAHLEEFTRMHPAIGEAWGNHLVWSVTRM